MSAYQVYAFILVAVIVMLVGYGWVEAGPSPRLDGPQLAPARIAEPSPTPIAWRLPDVRVF